MERVVVIEWVDSSLDVMISDARSVPLCLGVGETFAVTLRSHGKAVTEERLLGG
jgi:hypothetical protein